MNSKHDQLLDLISQAILVSGELSERMADKYHQCMHHLMDAKEDALLAIPMPGAKCPCPCHTDNMNFICVPCAVANNLLGCEELIPPNCR